MSFVISNDSDALLCVLYDEYLARRDRSIPIDAAAYFGDDDYIQSAFLPGWLREDVSTVCGWLCNKGLLHADYADDHALYVSLTEDGIIYMESRFANKRDAIQKRLQELISLGVSVAGFIRGI